MRYFDCAVIGTGPAGQKAAIQAAKLGKKVCIIEKENVLGGAAINTGTIPSKALREAVLHLTGLGKSGLFGELSRVKRNITIADLIYVSQQVIHHELSLIRNQLDRNGVELIWGAARFHDDNVLFIDHGETFEMISAEIIIIATGTRPARPESVPFDERTIFTSDGLLKLDHLPKTMIVVGGGVVGTEYACMLAALGVKVTLVEGRREVLGFLDSEIAEAFQYHMRKMGITLRLHEKVAKIEKLTPAQANREVAMAATTVAAMTAAEDMSAPAGVVAPLVAATIAPPAGNGHHQPHPGTVPGDGQSGNAPLVQATLESGKLLRAQSLLYAVGRQGTVGALDLVKADLKGDDRERMKVNEHYQTEQPHIYAVGDVIGFPALASTAMEQGRLAVCHAFGVPTSSIPELFPYGIYAIPEISMVGRTEAQLTDAGIPYEAGVAQYSELARGQLLGDETGMLKLLIHQTSGQILGVHAIGTGATELIHIGQAVMAFGGTVDFFINNVFNFPTLAEAYKVAALNGLNKLRHV
ncbi:MAG TPA: FAD-dependent oxidoreductase [Tepidisphaeraceae bacterium]|jgi:NAD(P) transhydrogenase|nr:FAD-dependent oxidoreductase [Tepidisphaeraceae bacterium]